MLDRLKILTVKPIADKIWNGLSLREKTTVFSCFPERVGYLKLTEEDQLLRQISHQINENSSEEEIGELLKVADVMTT